MARHWFENGALREPVLALCVALHEPKFDHIAAQRCGVFMEAGKNLIDLLLGVSDPGGEFFSQSIKDFQFLGMSGRDAD